jgi:cellulose synthase/poly-beta-1,6-N-acetylglucosamine synthase-like glycosyltransferase
LSGMDCRPCCSEDVCVIVTIRQPRCVHNLLNTKCNLSALCETITNTVFNEQDAGAQLCLLSACASVVVLRSCSNTTTKALLCGFVVCFLLYFLHVSLLSLSSVSLFFSFLCISLIIALFLHFFHSVFLSFGILSFIYFCLYLFIVSFFSPIFFSF